MTLTGVVLTMLFPLFVWISRGLTLCLCPLMSWRSRWRISLQRVGQSSNASWGSCRSLSRGCWKNMLLGKTHTPYTFMQRVFMMWSWVQRDCVFVIILNIILVLDDSSQSSCGSFPKYTSPHGQRMRWRMWEVVSSLNLTWPSDFCQHFISYLNR